MAHTTKPTKKVSDPVIYIVLIAACVAYWLPFFKNLDLVSFDGTSYLRQARDFFTGDTPGGAFPIGYPFFVALLHPVLGDLVRAGQIVSMLSGIGSVLILFVLAKQYMNRTMAFFCALFFAAMPLVLRISLITNSESSYIFWVLLGLLLYSRERYIGSSLAVGVAAITRPEALGIFVVLALLRIRRPRNLALMALAFVAIYSLNITAHYAWFDRVVILPKTDFFGTGSQTARERELGTAVILPEDDAADVSPVGEVAEEKQTTGKTRLTVVLRDYLRRLPLEIWLVARHSGYVILLLAILGMIVRTRWYLLASFVPFFVYPLFTVFSVPRFILPYVPFLVLYAFIGVDALKKPMKYVGYVLLVLGAVASIITNRNQFTDRVDGARFEFRDVGRQLRGRIPAGSKFADRKPHTAFYADAEYVPIPVGSYDATMQTLADWDVDYLCIHRGTLEKFRPVMVTLLDHKEMIRGELRFRPVYLLGDRMLIYERNRQAADLKWRKLTGSEYNSVAFPRWSPDGEHIAFQSNKGEQSDISVVSVETGEVSLLVDWPSSEGEPVWSPDGTRLAFVSNRAGNLDVFVLGIDSGDIKQVTTEPSIDVPTSWSPDGREVYFSSDRSGVGRVYSTDLATGETKRYGGDNIMYPSLSPDGNILACVRKRENLILIEVDTQREIVAPAPKKVHWAPTWSPDGRYIAVTAGDWGSDDVYLMKTGGSNALVLTKGHGFDGFPDWSPDGERLALVSDRSGESCVWIVSGLEPFLDRLSVEFEVLVLQDYESR
jgi:hypothetical protein